MLDLTKLQSIRGGAAHNAMRDFDAILRELGKRNADIPPLDPHFMAAIEQMPVSHTDLSITSTSVTPVLSGAQKTILSSPTLLGATLAAGKVVYADATTSPSGQLKGCTSGGVPATYAVVGILITGGNSGQLAIYAKQGQINMTVAGNLTVAAEYYMSANAGNICPVGDLATGNQNILLGSGFSASVFQIQPFLDFGPHP